MTEIGTEKSHSAPPFLEFGLRPPLSEISGSAPDVTLFTTNNIALDGRSISHLKIVETSRAK